MARCLQMVDEHLRQSDEVGTKHYMGSIHAQDNTRVKLQVLVSNINMVFSGWLEFDNPVSMTINLFISGL